MKINVIIPTYNRRHIITETINSIIFQLPSESTVIVVDDGSTDGTAEWLVERFRGESVKVIQNNQAKGPAGARNSGIHIADGDLIAFLDSDDIFLPNHLTDAIHAFEQYPTLGVVFGKALYERNGQEESFMGPNFEKKLEFAPKLFSNYSITIFADIFFDYLLEHGCWFNLSTVVLRREAAKELMAPSLRIGEDFEFWVRLSRKYQFACLHNNQIRYILHDKNISFEASSSAADNAPQLLNAYRIMLDYNNLNKNQKRIIKDNIGSVLFDWAYRCRLRGQLINSAKLNIRAMKYNGIIKNLLSIAKLPFAFIAKLTN